MTQQDDSAAPSPLFHEGEVSITNNTNIINDVSPTSQVNNSLVVKAVLCKGITLGEVVISFDGNITTISNKDYKFVFDRRVDPTELRIANILTVVDKTKVMIRGNVMFITDEQAQFWSLCVIFADGAKTADELKINRVLVADKSGQFDDTDNRYQFSTCRYVLHFDGYSGTPIQEVRDDQSDSQTTFVWRSIDQWYSDELRKIKAVKDRENTESVLKSLFGTE